MVDLHSHLIYGIDDGCTSQSEAVDIIKKAIDRGVTDIVITPHFILGSTYNKNNKEKEELFNNLKKEVKKLKLNINLYLGNEVYIENNIIDLFKSDIMPINGGKYVLFELPLNNTYHGLNSFIFDLTSNGYVPVLAHPERYEAFKRNPLLINDLLTRGVILQCNIGSFSGMYGKEAEKLVKLLARHKMIAVLGSDVHHIKHVPYDDLEDVKKYLNKYTDSEYLENIMVNNGLKIINNEDIKVEYEGLKKGLFNKIK